MGDRRENGRGLYAPARLDLIAWTGLVLVTLGAIAWFQTRHAAELQALQGFGMLGLMHPVWDLPQFARDFPNGEAEIMNSLVAQALRLAGAAGLPDGPVLWLAVFAEAAVLAAGAWLLARRLWPEAARWQHVAAALFLIAGTILSNDLGRWFHPFYGATYNFANGLGLVAVAAMLNRRPLLAGLAVGCAFLFHPTIPLFFGMAMTVIGLVRLREFGLPGLVAGGAFAISIAAVWTLAVLPSGSFASGGTVDAELYIELTRLMSSHWYPFSLGVFGERSWETLLPALALLLLALIYATGPQRSRRSDEIGLAIAFLFAFSLVGAVLAENSGSVLVVKLALHRASAVALLLAAVLVVPRLFDDGFNAWLPRAAMAGVLLLLPFWRDHGLPVFAAMGFAALVVFDERKAVSRRTTILRIAAILVVALVVFWLLLAGGLSKTFVPSLTGVPDLRAKLLLVALVGLAFSRLAGRPAIAAIAVGVGVYAWVPGVDPISDPETLEQARQYREVQDWARQNTPPDSLFMTDPAHSYGWRHYSQRPSFGTMREWLYSGWLYNTQPELMAEGLRRAEALGASRKELFSSQFPIGLRYAETAKAVTTRYNAASSGLLADLHDQFGVDYFVFDRTKLSGSADLPRPLFGNGRYVVVAAPEA